MNERQPTEKLALASGEYDLRKDEARKAGWPTRVTVPMIEKEFKLRPRTLTCYRANHYSRKNNNERRCAYCSGLFIPNMHNQKFCTYQCRWNSRAELQKEKYSKRKT